MMTRLRLTFRVFFAGILGFSFLWGCAHLEKEKSPEELMEQGTKQMDKGRYQSASESFQNLKDRYPYSKYAVLAELKMADALFLTPEYDLAFDAYDEFEKLHPRDKSIPYVIYQKGMCQFKQIKSIDREQSHTHKAKTEFERLIKRFPNDTYARRAIQFFRKCIVSLAKHELYVGHFYYKMKKYNAAMGRYIYLIENYPDMGQYGEALEYISKCREKLAIAQAKQEETSKNPSE